MFAKTFAVLLLVIAFAGTLAMVSCVKVGGGENDAQIEANHGNTSVEINK